MLAALAAERGWELVPLPADALGRVARRPGRARPADAAAGRVASAGSPSRSRRCATAGVPLLLDVAQSLGQTRGAGRAAPPTSAPAASGSAARAASGSLVVDPAWHAALRRPADPGARRCTPACRRLEQQEAHVAGRVGLAVAVQEWTPALLPRVHALAARPARAARRRRLAGRRAAGRAAPASPRCVPPDGVDPVRGAGRRCWRAACWSSRRPAHPRRRARPGRCCACRPPPGCSRGRPRARLAAAGLLDSVRAVTDATRRPAAPLQHSPLHDRHVALGAKIADFGGWEMPIEYPGGGVLKEHTAVREAVGVFDVSHLGKGVVRRRRARRRRRRLRQRPAHQRPAPRRRRAGAVHAVLRRPHRRRRRRPHPVRPQRGRGLPHPQRRQLQPGRVAAAADAPEGITVEDLHTTLAVIAVQGPRSTELVQALGLPTDHDYMSFTGADWQGRSVVVCRTGYTGERGYELLPQWDDAGRPLGRRARGRRAARRAALRPRRPRHAAHRDGLPAARPGPVARDHPRAGPRDLGRRLGQAALLGPRGAAARARGRPRARRCGGSRGWTGASPARTCRSGWASARSAR